MPWPSRLLVAASALLVWTVAASGVATAQDLPAGFTDGQPVGEEDGGTVIAPTGDAEAAAATQRYFGDGAYAAVRGAVSATTRSCTITDDGLTALVLAPVFKESSAATSPSTAPSPMTLSRYDEWSGTFGTTNNRDANYGLYAFRNPFTAFQRAYWHPGIGIWQYDSAGLGAPLTGVEAMDVGIVVRDVARIMSTRYCNAGGSDQNRRYEAWRDWGFPCTLCQGFFDEMVGTSPKFANLNLVAGITALGGTVRRTCVLQGVLGTMPCWYVEPRVGVIQGSTAWATLSPTGGSGPTVAPAPLSHPFYVLDRGATEERHWMRADTGYSTDIRATRAIGKNARPRSNQSGSGLTWASTSGLCDITTGRGACVPLPPAGVSSAPITIVGNYRAVPLDADGDGLEDVLLYRPGSATDVLWLGDGAGAFSARGVSINSTYDDILAGDVDGDGDDDVVFYDRSSGAAYLWRSDGDGTFTSSPLSPGSGRRPFLLDADGDGDQEVFWYGPGSVPDSQWHWSGGRFVGSARTVRGVYTPLVGDFDGNGRDDIFWYAPGNAADNLWRHAIGGGVVSSPKTVRGTYSALVANLDGDASDDIVWYAPGSAGDHVWFGGPGGSFASHSVTVNGSYFPIVASLDTSGRDGVIWYAPGAGQDFWWRWEADRSRTSTSLILPSSQAAVVGRFSAGGADGILWHHVGSIPDVVWYR